LKFRIAFWDSPKAVWLLKKSVNPVAAIFFVFEKVAAIRVGHHCADSSYFPQTER
jgi:hypothetical protein